MIGYISMKNKNLTLIFLVASFTLITNTNAYAVSKRVSSPNVSPGLSADTRGSYAFNDEGGDDFTNNIQFKYGFNDKFRLSFDTDYRKRAGEDGDFTNSDIEFRYNFFRNENTALALSGGYEFNHVGDADGIFTSMQGQYKTGQWKHQANLGVDTEIGNERGDGFDYDFRSGHYYDLETVEVGVEYFADFGNSKDGDSFNEQEHNIGPVVNFTIPVGQREVDAVLGYAVGLTDASDDHLIKYEFGYKF